MNNLKNLKQATIRWAKAKKLDENAKLEDLESKIAESHLGVGPGFGSDELKIGLIQLEKRR